MEYKLTVAICTYNRERYLPQLFDSILAQSLYKSLFEVVLVNNNSTDQTEVIVNQFIQKEKDLTFHYFNESQQGLSYARNRCIQEAKGEFITFLDDDAFIHPDYLEVILNRFTQNTEFAAIGGPIFLHYESVIPAWENKYLNSLLGYYSPSTLPFTYSGSSSEYPRGSNMSFRMEIFEIVGLFNVQLGRTKRNLIGGEEKDIFERIYATKKYQVYYEPAAIVFHCVPEERTSKDFIIRQAYGTGLSEKYRTKSIGTIAYFKRVFLELIKWVASFVLWVKFSFSGQIQKANMLLVFRKHVSRGLLGKQE